MPDLHLKVQLPTNRNGSGIVTIWGADGIKGRFEILGRGSRGAGDTQMQVRGNTPTGTYRVSEMVNTSQWNQNSYGPNGALRLDPQSGNAQAAEALVGRSGLLIHGGSEGGASYWRGAGELRATHGCLRLSNTNMKTLMDAVFGASLNPRQSRSEPVEVKVTVTDHNMSFARP